MAGKGTRKHHQPIEDNQEEGGERGEDIRTVLELFLESQ